MRLSSTFGCSRVLTSGAAPVPPAFLDLLGGLPEEQVWAYGGAEDADDHGCSVSVRVNFGHNVPIATSLHGT